MIPKNDIVFNLTFCTFEDWYWYEWSNWQRWWCLWLENINLLCSLMSKWNFELVVESSLSQNTWWQKFILLKMSLFLLQLVLKKYQDRRKVSLRCYTIHTRIRTEEEVETLKTPYQQQTSSSKNSISFNPSIPFLLRLFSISCFRLFSYKYCKRG